MYRPNAEERKMIRKIIAARKPGTIRTSSMERDTQLTHRLKSAGHKPRRQYIHGFVVEISLPDLSPTEAARAIHKIYCDACWSTPAYLSKEARII